MEKGGEAKGLEEGIGEGVGRRWERRWGERVGRRGEERAEPTNKSCMLVLLLVAKSRVSKNFYFNGSF